MQLVKEKVKIKENKVRADIPITFLRYLQSRNEERVLEVVLVYNGVDRFDTIITPEGMETDPSTVTIDYNHRGVDTGAYLSNLKVVKDYEIEGINGKNQRLESALIGELHIPKTAEMFYHTKDGEKRSNGNLYEAVNNGHIKSVSVDFRPKRQKTDTKTGITTYITWDLIRLSVLDVTPGQPYSGIKVLRYFDTSDQKSDDIKSKIQLNIMSNKLNLNLEVNSEELQRKLESLSENEAFKDLSEEQIKEVSRAISDSLTEKKEETVTEPDKPVAEPEGEPEPDLRTYMEEMRGYMQKTEERMAKIEEKLASLEPKTKEKPENSEEEELKVLKETERKLKEKKENQPKNNAQTRSNTDNTRQTQTNVLDEPNGVQYQPSDEEIALSIQSQILKAKLNNI